MLERLAKDSEPLKGSIIQSDAVQEVEGALESKRTFTNSQLRALCKKAVAAAREIKQSAAEREQSLEYAAAFNMFSFFVLLCEDLSVDLARECQKWHNIVCSDPDGLDAADFSFGTEDVNSLLRDSLTIREVKFTIRLAANAVPQKGVFHRLEVHRRSLGIYSIGE